MNDIGYELEYIGLKVTFPDGKEVRPDLSFKSHQANTLLLGEAKSGGVDNEQASRYKALTPELISTLGLTKLPAPKLNLDVFYACTKANRESVMANEARHQWGFPILSFDGTILKKEKTNARFKDPAVEKLFADGITFDHELTCAFYPFGEGDSDGYIVSSVLMRLAFMWTQGQNRFTVEGLVEECHPLMGYFDRSEKIRVFAVVRSLLTDISRAGNRRFVIRPIRGSEWQIDAFAAGRFARRLIMGFADTFDHRDRVADLERLFKEAAEEEEKEKKGQIT